MSRTKTFICALTSNVVFALVILVFVSLGITSNLVIVASGLLGSLTTALLLGKAS